jgi:hypothetical protein
VEVEDLVYLRLASTGSLSLGWTEYRLATGCNNWVGVCAKNSCMYVDTAAARNPARSTCVSTALH